MEKMIDRQRRRWVDAALIFLVVILAALFPLESDDCYFYFWQYGSFRDFLMARPDTTLAKLVGIPQNGRYLGNMLGVVLAKAYDSPFFLLRVVYFAGGLLTLAWAGAKALCRTEYRRPGMWFLLSMLILAPRGLWQEVYSWGAAYVNYVTPVVLMAVLLVLLRRAARACSGPLSALIAVTAFGACLFMEPDTLFLCASASVFLLWTLKTGRLRRPAAALWLGSVAGTAVMFAAPGYGSVGTDGLREFGLDLLGDSLSKLLVGTLVRPVAVALVITGLLLWLLREQGGSSWRWCAAAALPIHLLCLADGLRELTDPGTTVTLQAPPAWQLVTALALAALWLTMAVLWKGGRDKVLLWGLIGALVLVSGPLLVVSVRGNRFFFAGYAVLALTALVLWQSARVRGMKPMGWIRVCALVCACGLVAVYACNCRVYRQRLTQARRDVAAGAAQLTLPLVPFAGFARNEQIWKGDIAYQIYREQPWDVTFTFVPYDQWTK